MIIQASNGCYLTENFDVPIKDRRFIKSILVGNIEEAALWKEVTEAERDQIIAEENFYHPDTVDYNYLKKIDSLKITISEKINDSQMSVDEALGMKEYFPTWESLIGQQAIVGYRFQDEGTLFEVIMQHTFSAEWKPNSGTESLYKVVQIESAGTIDDPITWKYNMELFEGLYYIDKDILYRCIRNSGQGMAYDNLADLVSGGFVEIVESEPEPEPEPEPGQDPDGSIEHPIPYVKGETSLEKDKYYLENGIIYLAIQSAGPQIYGLSEMPSIAQKVE